MEKCYDCILIETEKKISELEKSEKDEITIAENAIVILQNSLWQLRALVKKNDFSNKEEEILFFKEIKLTICCQLIFYAKLLKIELKKPIG